MHRASHQTRLATVSRSLAQLAEFGDRLSGAPLNCTPCPSCDGDVMLIVESTAPDGGDADPATWVVTLVPGGRMALEAVVNETRFDLLAIGPADRILAVLEALAAPAKVDA